jgi:hypothetical protein
METYGEKLSKQIFCNVGIPEEGEWRENLFKEIIV